ncbi:hypothetical protein CLOM_g24114, partial [Closterium sp. NIES-68]
LVQSKCNFLKLELEFLGHIVSTEGVKIDPRKSRLSGMEATSNIKELQSFLGFVNYVRRFIPNMAGKPQAAFDKLKIARETLATCHDGLRDRTANRSQRKRCHPVFVDRLTKWLTSSPANKKLQLSNCPTVHRQHHQTARNAHRHYFILRPEIHIEFLAPPMGPIRHQTTVLSAYHPTD